MVDTPLEKLALLIEQLDANGSPALNNVPDSGLLLHSVRDLDGVIGNTKLKKSVAAKVKSMLLQADLGNDDYAPMVNVMLMGPPGVGKTTIASKIANIWRTMGLIDTPENVTEEDEKNHDPHAKMTGTAYLVYAGTCSVISLAGWSVYSSLVDKGYSKVLAGGVAIVMIIVLLVLVFAIAKNTSKISAAYNRRMDPENVSEESDKPKLKTGMVILKRGHFVAKFHGHTEEKVEKVLDKYDGHVMFIDEAYTLVNGEHDLYGKIAVDMISERMSLKPRSCVIIFSGYNDEKMAGVYEHQPGLRRRIPFKFICDGYNKDELAKIFRIQLTKENWTMENWGDVNELFNDDDLEFKEFGGDTLNLVQHSISAYSEEWGIKSDITPSVIKRRHLIEAIKVMKEDHKVTEKPIVIPNDLSERIAELYREKH